ncbi:MAG: cyclic nucleotide-binding domain-containing protein [Deltaproteobacteria bacterium]|nr:cyclic nucleotide-binding domain-containing protein [Deltaproteobacteria bacterium]
MDALLERITDPQAVNEAGLGFLFEWLVGRFGSTEAKVRRELSAKNFNLEDQTLLLAATKSWYKYDYPLSLPQARSIIQLAAVNRRKFPLYRLIHSNSFLLIKTTWLLEHSPYFLMLGDQTKEDHDQFILDFSSKYDRQFLRRVHELDRLSPQTEPFQVLSAGFWENRFWDPLDQILDVYYRNLRGIELSFDFHPFNATRLLPEELSPSRRALIRSLVDRAGVVLSIHSPIVGPYFPKPNPRQGKQHFANPGKKLNLIKETIQLGLDIKAKTVVVHAVDLDQDRNMAELVKFATRGAIHVTFENYCDTKDKQTTQRYLDFISRIKSHLTDQEAADNFGITFDSGHINIEGEDPVKAAVRVGKWVVKNKIFLHVHATDNYGQLLYSPPNFSADVHSNVAGKGINNEMIIKIFRSMGLNMEVVAEQIQPLSKEDIRVIDQAKRCRLDLPFEQLVALGRERLADTKPGNMIQADEKQEDAYLFMVGLDGEQALREHLILRRIQEKKYLSTEQAKQASIDLMKMPLESRTNIIEYLDEFLYPIHWETGVAEKREIDLICQNISGALFGAINNEHLSRIFSKTKTFSKGEIICRQGTVGDEMYFIKVGRVRVVVDEVDMAQLGIGELFGEISLFYNIPRTASVVADQDGTLIGILSRRTFEKMMEEESDHVRSLIYRLYLFLPQRLRNLNEKYKSAVATLRHLFGHNLSEQELLDNAESDMKLFKVLPADILGQDLGRLFSHEKVFPAGAVVFLQGETGDGAYLVDSGRLTVIGTYNEEKIPLGDIKENEIFGEMSLIDHKPRSATVTAIVDTRVKFLPKKEFAQLMDEKSSLTFRFMSSISLNMFRHIQRLDSGYAKLKTGFLTGPVLRDDES